MYIVKWNDFEGNEQQRPLPTLEDAIAEARDLEEKYVGVEVLDPSGNRVYL